MPVTILRKSASAGKFVHCCPTMSEGEQCIGGSEGATAGSKAADKPAVECSSRARVVMQQCLSAELQVQPATEDSPAEYVQIGLGAVIYICFLQGATSDTVNSVVKGVVNIRLSENTDGKFVSLLSLPGDVLIVPQATLGGKAKGHVMQYHKNVDKSTGERLYSELVRLVEEKVGKNAASVERGCVVRSGTYGNRQVLKMNTNGPFSHLLEF